MATAKKQVTTSAALVGEFDKKGFIGAGDTYLRKADKKDLSNITIDYIYKIIYLESAMTAEDWETKYKEAWERFKQEKQKTNELKERMTTKQERYIAREQEYRKTIEQIEKDIAVHSTKPLEII